MKKIISIALIMIVCCLTICGCNSSENNSKSEGDLKAKVVNNDGVTEYLTKHELYDLQSKNSVNFQKKYWCSHVSVTGKITSIEGLHIRDGMTYFWSVRVGDWFVGDTSYNECNISDDFIASLNEGDMVEISGDLVSPGDLSNGKINIVKK